MKKAAAIFFFLLSFTHQSSAQMGLNEITGSYFRSNPYNREFSKFLNLLVNDPAISNKTVNKRTDSSFFYFKGEYKNYSPFFYKATRTEIILAETEVVVDDSTGKLDTIMAYQLLGYTVGGKQGEDDVKQEFSKFQKRVKRKFWGSDPEDIKNGDEITGQIQNYFLLPYPISPMTAGWGKLSDNNEYVFVITIRMKVRQNWAILP